MHGHMNVNKTYLYLPEVLLFVTSPPQYVAAKTLEKEQDRDKDINLSKNCSNMPYTLTLKQFLSNQTIFRRVSVGATSTSQTPLFQTLLNLWGLSKQNLATCTKTPRIYKIAYKVTFVDEGSGSHRYMLQYSLIL